jgi:hypothetical protein
LLALDVPQAASGAESARGLARVAGANLQIASVVNDPHFPSPHLTARTPAIKSRKPSPRGVLYHPLEARCKRISMDAMRCAARSRRRKPAGFSTGDCSGFPGFGAEPARLAQTLRGGAVIGSLILEVAPVMV